MLENRCADINSVMCGRHWVLRSNHSSLHARSASFVARFELMEVMGRAESGRASSIVSLGLLEYNQNEILNRTGISSRGYQERVPLPYGHGKDRLFY